MVPVSEGTLRRALREVSNVYTDLADLLLPGTASPNRF
jgi:hypothetical protein